MRTVNKASPRTCPVCGSIFTPRWKKRRQKLCSRRRRGAKNAAMFRDFDPSVHERSARTRADQVRGTGTKSRYVKRGGRHEHRVVMEGLLGRQLRPGEIVHHRDDDPKNNAPANLVLLPSQSAHAKLHKLGLLGKRWTSSDPALRRGQQCSHAKLTDEKVRAIRERYKSGGMSMKAIGLMHGVCTETVSRIVHRKAWSHVK